MRLTNLTRTSAIIVAAVTAARAPVRAEEQYWALFRDGSIVTANEIRGGDPFGNVATLAGRRLFGVANSLAVLRDNTLRWSPAGPCVMMANGDVVPGKVLRFLPASPSSRLPPRLLISPHRSMKASDPNGLAVRADRVLRIVSTGDPPARPDPGALVFADGRTATASALHWSGQGIRALTDTGILTARFDELADLAVEGVDVIAAVLADSRHLPTDRPSLIGRLETVDGAVLTYRRTTARVTVAETAGRQARRRTAEPKRTLHLKPSWALGAITVPVERVWQRSYRAANEVPLSLLPATVLKQRSGLHHWPWRRNRNVRGEILQSGPLTVGLGVGTHPYSEIAFELPPGARRFITLVGLDHVVGEAGCARVMVYRDAVAGEPLFSSGFLRGAETPVLIGPLDVTHARHLILVTESAHDDRPPGADPLDIGDHVDWLMPMVFLENVGVSP